MSEPAEVRTSAGAKAAEAGRQVIRTYRGCQPADPRVSPGCESPFTGNGPQCPDVIFTEEQADGIVTVLHDVRQQVLPDATVA